RDFMLLFLKSIPRLYRSARKDLSRHFPMAFSSALSIGIALLIAMLLVVVAANINRFTNSIEEELVIQASISPTLAESSKESLREQIAQIDGIESVQFSSKEEELDKLIQENGDVFSRYAEEGRNPLYDIYIIEVRDPEHIDEISAAVEEIPGINAVNYGGGAITKLVSIFQVLRRYGSVLVLFMILLAIFLIRNTIKMTIHVRKDEIAIMRQVGAYNWYITTPFVLEGMVIGAWGALIPALLVGIGYPLFYQGMHGVFISDLFQLLAPFPFVVWIVLGLFAIGLGTGMIGSFLAVRKYVRWIR
ncbi:permease-like cell division protein FtsX, partial [uncultured Dubosiella sp.]